MAKTGLAPIIDVHAHPPMPSLMKALRAVDPSGQPHIDPLRVAVDWTPDDGLKLMDEHGIQAMVMSNTFMPYRDPSQMAELARAMNEEMAAVVSKYPKRFGAFATLPLMDIESSLVEMRYALDELKMDGVCLLTNVDGLYPGEPRFEPLFAELNRRKAVAFVHPAIPPYSASIPFKLDPAVLEFMFDSNRAAASLVLSGYRRKYPDFTYIATHGGGTIPYLIHRLETGRFATAAYGVDLSPEELRQGFQSLHYELTCATSTEQIAALREVVDMSKLLLGFDYPIRATSLIAPAQKDLIECRLLSDGDRHAIARGNALTLFPKLA